jgi:aryl-alcohol dehydrogenase-like predicted oxidoreductase
VLNRDVEHELVPLSIDQGLGNLVWSPLAGGLLSGKLIRDRDEERIRAWREPPVPDAGRVFDVLDVVAEVAAEHQATVAQVAIAYLLAKCVTSVIIGPKNLEQIESALPAVSIVFTSEQLTRLDEASRQPLPYPYWHQAHSIGDRLGPADQTLHSAASAPPPRYLGTSHD